LVAMIAPERTSLSSCPALCRASTSFLLELGAKTWMAATSAAMTKRKAPLSLLRNDRQQQERLLVPAGIDPVLPVVVVGAGGRAGRAVRAVARLDVETDAVALLEHHRGRPDLDLHLHDLIRLEPQSPQVLVIGPVGQRQLGIELAMRHAQPALGDRAGLT